MRLIIHFKEGQNKTVGLSRLMNGLFEYYRLKPPEDDRRLTVRFEKDGAMIIYHNQKDVVIFDRKSFIYEKELEIETYSKDSG